MSTNILSESALQNPTLSPITEADTVLYLSAEKWPLPYLVDYILQNHHFYVSDALPRIIGLLEKVVTEYGLIHPQLEHIYQTFRALSMQLISQMRKEEVILFPYITILAKPKDKSKEDCCTITSLAALLQEIEAEHHTIEQGLVEIRRLTQNFTLPPQVCQSYALLFQWLEKFEKDIYQHEYLENIILFPKALAFEKSEAL
jgi:regulator of cell morphogenesis and NO signaling